LTGTFVPTRFRAVMRTLSEGNTDCKVFSNQKEIRKTHAIVLENDQSRWFLFIETHNLYIED